MSFIQRVRKDTYYMHKVGQFYPLWMKLREGYAYEQELDICCRFIPSSSGSLVLDAAAGTGRFYEALKSHEVVFLDYSTIMVKLLKRIKGRTSIVRGDVKHLPFRRESISHILLIRFLPHTSSHVSVLREMRRVLTLKGTMAFDIVNYISLTTLISKLFRIIDFYPSKKGEVESALENVGFHVAYRIERFFLPAIIYRFLPRVICKFADKIPFLKCRTFYKVTKR